MELYDLIQEFEISLYFSTVLLKYLTVIIGLFTVLVMIVRCYMYSICIAAKQFVLRHVWVIAFSVYLLSYSFTSRFVVTNLQFPPVDS